MGIKLSQLPVTDTVTTAMYYDSTGCHPVRKGDTRPKETFDITYRPRFYTRAYEAKAKAERETEGIGASTITQFLTFIAAWDVLSDDGKPIPLTAESLDGRSTRMLNDIMDGCYEDMRPDPTTSAS